MTDATAFAEQDGLEKAAVRDNRLNRPARPSELKMVHTRLMEAIVESEHYSDEFKTFESGRLTLGYLRNLMAVDPRHVLLALSDGEVIGLQITGPEQGTLWHYWSYMFPEARKRVSPIRFLPALANVWENDRFHKLAAYTKPSNKAAIALFRRAKFAHVVTLEKHLFGEDYMLFEKPLNKALPGHDHGLGLGFSQRLKNRLLAALGL